jgi:hypothetical protein
VKLEETKDLISTAQGAPDTCNQLNSVTGFVVKLLESVSSLIIVWDLA